MILAGNRGNGGVGTRIGWFRMRPTSPQPSRLVPLGCCRERARRLQIGRAGPADVEVARIHFLAMRACNLGVLRVLSVLVVLAEQCIGPIVVVIIHHAKRG